MRKFKTAEDNRTNYIYYFNDGTSYTITPGENGENATIISQLHGMDEDLRNAEKENLKKVLFEGVRFPLIFRLWTEG